MQYFNTKITSKLKKNNCAMNGMKKESRKDKRSQLKCTPAIE